MYFIQTILYTTKLSRGPNRGSRIYFVSFKYIKNVKRSNYHFKLFKAFSGFQTNLIFWYEKEFGPYKKLRGYVTS